MSVATAQSLIDTMVSSMNINSTILAASDSTQKTQLSQDFSDLYSSMRDVFTALKTVTLSDAERSAISDSLTSSVGSVSSYLDQLKADFGFLQSGDLISYSAISQSSVVADTLAFMDNLQSTTDSGLSIAGIDMTATLASNLEAASQAAVELVLQSLGAELGITTSYTSEAAAQSLLAGNTTLLSRLADVVLIDINDIDFETTPVSSALKTGGLTNTQADDLASDLGVFVNAAEQILDTGSGAITLSTALDSLLGTTTSSDSLTNSVSYSSGGTPFNVYIKSVSIAPPSLPTGSHTLSDGSIIIVGDGLAVITVSTVADTVAFASAIDSVGNGLFTTRITPEGVIEIQETATGAIFNATVSTAGGTQVGAGSGVSFGAPTETDPASPNFSFTVTFANGEQQVINPITADQSFFTSVANFGFSVVTDRSTGIVSIDGFQFRPDYFQVPATAADTLFRLLNMDSSGVAYKAAGDINGDGTEDYRIITSSGSQVFYTLP